MVGDDEPRTRIRAYRRLAIGASIATGIAVGLGLGGLAVLSNSVLPLLLLGTPLAIRVLATTLGHTKSPDRTIAWLWPIVAGVVAVTLAILLPPGLAPLSLSIAIALWFTTVIVFGILDVTVDPEGRLGL